MTPKQHEVLTDTMVWLDGTGEPWDSEDFIVYGRDDLLYHGACDDAETAEALASEYYEGIGK